MIELIEKMKATNELHHKIGYREGRTDILESMLDDFKEISVFTSDQGPVVSYEAMLTIFRNQVEKL